MIRVYGIANCDIIKKARNFLDREQVPYEFIDYKKHPVTEELLTSWFEQREWNEILNKKSTSWRELPEERKQKIQSVRSAIPVILENNSIIKRPVITQKGKILVIGFNEALYKDIFKQ